MFDCQWVNASVGLLSPGLDQGEYSVVVCQLIVDLELTGAGRLARAGGLARVSAGLVGLCHCLIGDRQ